MNYNNIGSYLNPEVNEDGVGGLKLFVKVVAHQTKDIYLSLLVLK